MHPFHQHCQTMRYLLGDEMVAVPYKQAVARLFADWLARCTDFDLKWVPRLAALADVAKIYADNSNTAATFAAALDNETKELL